MLKVLLGFIIKRKSHSVVTLHNRNHPAVSQKAVKVHSDAFLADKTQCCFVLGVLPVGKNAIQSHIGCTSCMKILILAKRLDHSERLQFSLPPPDLNWCVKFSGNSSSLEKILHLPALLCHKLFLVLRIIKHCFYVNGNTWSTITFTKMKNNSVLPVFTVN